MTVTSEDLNAVPRVTATFVNASNVNTDPTTVTFTVVEPDGTSTTYTYGTDVEVVKSATGIYYTDVLLSSTGRWSVTSRGTGTVADAETTEFIVGVSNAYCTLQQLKDELGLTDTGDDSKLQASINAASRMIDGWCGQRFWMDASPVARTFTPEDSMYLDLDEGIASTSGLAIALDLNDVGTYGTTLTTGTDFILRPTNALLQYPARPYDRIDLTGVNYVFSRSSYGRDLVQITARWGWPAVPDDVNKAALIQAADLFKAKDAVFGVAGGNEFGALRVTSGLHRMAASLVAPYRRPAVG